MISHTVMMQIIDRVSIIVACIVFKEIAKQFKLSDRSNLFSNILLTSVIVILMIIDILNGNYGVLFKPYYLIGMLAIYCKIIYDINWFKNIMYTIAYVYSYKILDYALYWVVFKFTPKYDATIIQIKSLVLMIIILIIILKCIKKIKIIDSYKLHYIFIVIAITGNIITTIFTFMVEKSIFYSEDIFLNVSGAVLNNMLPLIMTVSSSVLILVVKKIIEDADLKAENKIVKEKMDMQYKYYLGIQESQNKVKRLYHDMNNHIFCIKNMYESNNSVDEYVNNINENIEDYKNIFDTKNMILDIILNEKKYL